MKKTVIVFSLLCFFVITNAQKKSPEENTKSDKPAAPLNRMVVVDSAVVTKSEVTIKGQRVPYTATAGTMPVWDEDGKAIAGVFEGGFGEMSGPDRSLNTIEILSA